MEQSELLKAAETAAFIEKEIARLMKEAGESGETVRRRNRDYIENNPFGSVYGDSDALVRENERTLEDAQKKRAEARLLKQVRLSPYFGRVDFTYADDGEREEIYVGLKTLVENRRFLVYDWRAPISALFYYGELGRASYTAPCGEVEGEITRLRQYTFKSGELKNYWDAEIHIDDAVLTAVLSGGAAEHMRPIVYTIQREQNAAIRYPAGKNLAVFGPAGCGKTAVGMHRLAWLMYQAQTGGKPVSTLMLTSNAAFRSYVSSVLPALGETETEAVSFTELFERHLPGYKVQPALLQTQALIEKDAFRTGNVTRLYAPAFIDYMEERTSKLPVRFKNIYILDDLALSAETMEHRFRGLPQRVPVKNRLDTVADWVQEELENYFLIHRKALLQTILDRSELGESYTQQYFRLRRRVIEGARQMVLSAATNDPAALLKELYAAFYGTDAYFTALSARLQTKDAYYEDAAAMLFLTVRLGSTESYVPTHVLIDEAQDLSPLQHRTLRALYKKAVFTVLADPNQGVAPAADTATAEEIASLYGADTVTISKSYRSTREIGEYAKRFLPPDAPDYRVFDRSGPAPEIVTAPAPAEETAKLLEDAARRGLNACVLLPDLKSAEAFYKKLRGPYPAADLISTDRQTLAGKPVCMPAALAKGLEFDCVILPLSSENPPDDRILYLCCTRALHELHLLFDGEIPERFGSA